MPLKVLREHGWLVVCPGIRGTDLHAELRRDCGYADSYPTFLRHLRRRLHRADRQATRLSGQSGEFETGENRGTSDRP